MNRMLGFCCGLRDGRRARRRYRGERGQQTEPDVSDYAHSRLLPRLPVTARHPVPDCGSSDAVHASAPEQNRWCHEAGNHWPRLQKACVRSDVVAFQARHPLGYSSVSAVRPLPAPVPWALLRPPPSVRPRSPSDLCHLWSPPRCRITPRGDCVDGLNQHSTVWYDLRRCSGMFANRCWRSTAQVNRSRTVESAWIGCNRPPGK